MNSFLNRQAIGFVLGVLALSACLVGITKIGRDRGDQDEPGAGPELTVVELDDRGTDPDIGTALPITPDHPEDVPETVPPIETGLIVPDDGREPPPQDIGTFIGIARRQIMENEFEDAGAAFAAALRLAAGMSADNGEARWLQDELGDAYWRRYDYGGPEAETACREMIEGVLAATIREHRGHAFARDLLARLLRKSHRQDRLFDLFEPEDMPIDRDDPNDLALYGRAMVRAERGAEVLPELLRAYRRSRESWRLTYAIGLAHKQAGERVQARIKFKQSLLHCPDDKSRSTVRDALEGL